MEAHVWVYDLGHGTARRLTSEGWTGPVTWTRDGRRLVFSWMKTGAANIYWQPADGSSRMERLTQSQNFQRPGSWSPDGKVLAFVEEQESRLPEIELFNVSDRRVTPFLNSRFYEGYPEFSPDGRWMAYVSNESGRAEVYVQPFPGGGGKEPISNNGGDEPLWSPNGKQLYYRSVNPKNQVWVVDVQTGSGFSAGKPRLLFDQPGYSASAPIRAVGTSPPTDSDS